MEGDGGKVPTVWDLSLWVEGLESEILSWKGLRRGAELVQGFIVISARL